MLSPHSSTRPGIFGGLSAYRVALKGLIADCEHILDGSFVTSKNDPGDVDCFVCADVSVVNALHPTAQEAFRDLVSGKATQAHFHVDAYFCPSTSTSDPDYDRYRRIRKYWLGEFGYDRQERPKGLVRVVDPPVSAQSA